MELIIQGALANTGGEVSSNDLLTFLKENTQDVEYYRFSPPPGSIVAVAFDWIAVLGVTASSIEIARALWAAYRKFIKPLKEKGRDSSFLFVAVKNKDNEFVQFSIGQKDNNKEDFIMEFSDKIEKLRIDKDSNEIEIEKRELKLSERWKKV
jgi:hypothetical protein